MTNHLVGLSDEQLEILRSLPLPWSECDQPTREMLGPDGGLHGVWSVLDYGIVNGSDTYRRTDEGDTLLATIDRLKGEAKQIVHDAFEEQRGFECLDESEFDQTFGPVRTRIERALTPPTDKGSE